MPEMRCENKLHGIIADPCVVEVKCGAGHCGAGPGVVVIHRFSAADGSLIDTRHYKDYPRGVTGGRTNAQKANAHRR